MALGKYFWIGLIIIILIGTVFVNASNLTNDKDKSDKLLDKINKDTLKNKDTTKDTGKDSLKIKINKITETNNVDITEYEYTDSKSKKNNYIMISPNQ